MSLLSPDSEAARYIKGLDRRLNDVEGSPEQEGSVNLTRKVSEQATCEDYVNAEVIDSTEFYYSYPNFFSPSGKAFSVGYWHSDVTQVGEESGFSDVGEVDTSGSAGNIFTGEFVQSDFPHYSAVGASVYLAFAAKWDAFPTWEYPGTWVEQPAPSASSYQLYVLKSDGDNSGSEYFRLYYDGSEGASEASLADTLVWKQYGEAENSASIVGTDRNRTVVSRPGAEWSHMEYS